MSLARERTLFDNGIMDFATKKQEFLHSLRGVSQKYKRYNGAILRYGGGKSLAVGTIVEYFPNDLTRLISPFIGGGSVEIATAKELGVEVVGYDIFDILVNFYQVLLQNPKKLREALLQISPTKENYATIKDELKKHWQKEMVLDKFRLAVDYYFNFNLSYGPGFLGWMSSIYGDEVKYKKSLDKFLTMQDIPLQVHCDSFENVFAKYPNDFFYLDPPYFLNGDSKMFRGIYPQRNFPIHHNNFNHELLCECVKNHKGKFILSYNDCAWVRNAYKDYLILEPSWQYTMGQGETRIGKNRIERGDNDNIKKSHELLIVKE